MVRCLKNIKKIQKFKVRLKENIKKNWIYKKKINKKLNIFFIFCFICLIVYLLY